MLADAPPTLLVAPSPSRFRSARRARVGPAEVDAALVRAKVPAEAVVAVVQEVGATRPRLAWQPDQAANPASLMKLLTTYAALELLGPAWTWTTPVWLQGRVADGVLDGDLVIKGTGDPKLVLERIWLLLRRVQQQGVREIRGDIVLDRSAFLVPEQAPADFDGEPLRPYNVRPDALLLNYRSLLLTFTPDSGRGSAQVSTDPPLAGVQVDATLPLSAAPCEDWRAGLKADFGDPARSASPAPFRPPAARRPGPSPTPTRRATTSAPSPGCGRRWAASWAVACARAAPQPVNNRCLRGLADAGRGDARHQQVQQQRDGAAAVPDARPQAAWARHPGDRTPGAAPVAGRALRRRRRRRGDRQRLGPVARRAHQRAPARAAAAVRMGEPGDARADELAAGRRRRRHACGARVHRRAARI